MSLQSRWFEPKLSPALWPLFLLHPVFVLLSGMRRVLYRSGLLPQVRLPVPVVVVGNLIVGGAGKTPLTIWLAKALQARGRRPGIISRGYGGQGGAAQAVTADSSPAAVGDEPLLLQRHCGVPVWVGHDRAAAGAALLAAHPEVDLLIADDGLQHYRLARDAEIAVFDARGVGNGWRLPLGPLREPLSRVRRVTAVVCNGAVESIDWPPAVPRFAMQLQPANPYRLGQPQARVELAVLRGRQVHAVAGIGHPARFFATLRTLGLEVIEHPFPDHHVFSAADLDFGPDAVILMTEKDAVKCAGLTSHQTWVLPVTAELPAALTDTLLEKLYGR